MFEKIVELLKEYKWQAGIVAVGLVIGGSFVLGRPSEASQEQATLLASSVTEESSSKAPESSTAENDSDSSALSTEVVVDVKGAVKTPGLYTLKPGSRINDAVKAAGGFAENADQKSVNLAQKVSDESVVYVAAVGEGVSVVESSQAAPAGTASSSAVSGTLVNLNTATEAELQTISGIGAKRAADIIAYRDANGGFKTVDDLNKVSGIGDKTMENIRPYVTVE